METEAEPKELPAACHALTTSSCRQLSCYEKAQKQSFNSKHMTQYGQGDSLMHSTGLLGDLITSQQKTRCQYMGLKTAKNQESAGK